MKAIAKPTYFPAVWGYDASGSFIRQVPTLDPGTPGAASLQLGWPPANFVDPEAGGVPPDGRDGNGINQQMTAGIQWLQAGGIPYYDATLSTAIGGYPNGAILAKADGSGLWVSTADDNTSDPDTAGANWNTIASSQAIGPYSVKGLVGINNASTPNTKYDLTLALQVVARNSTSGVTYTKENQGSITCDLTLPASGSTPTANGCDSTKLSASVSIWVHFYYIYNPTTNTWASLASANAPSTGPVGLPSGYTAWAYATTIRLDASGHLIVTETRGITCSRRTAGIVLSSGSATSETPIDLTTFVPPNALDILGFVSSLGGTSDGSGDLAVTANLRVATGLNSWTGGIQLTTAAASSGIGVPGGWFELPNDGQNINYILTVGSGSAPSVTVQISGYTIPNN